LGKVDVGSVQMATATFVGEKKGHSWGKRINPEKNDSRLHTNPQQYGREIGVTVTYKPGAAKRSLG